MIYKDLTKIEMEVFNKEIEELGDAKPITIDKNYFNSMIKEYKKELQNNRKEDESSISIAFNSGVQFGIEKVLRDLAIELFNKYLMYDEFSEMVEKIFSEIKSA